MAENDSLLGRLFLILDSRAVRTFYTSLPTGLDPPSEESCVDTRISNLGNRLRAAGKRACRANHRAIVGIGMNATHIPESVYYNCAMFLLSLNRE